MSSVFYITSFCLAALFAYVYDVNKKQKERVSSNGLITNSNTNFRKLQNIRLGSLGLLVSIAILVLIRGFRYGIAFDYFGTYVPRFNGILAGSWSKGDWLYDLFIWVCTQISADYRVFFFLDTVLFVAVLMVAVKYSKCGYAVPILLLCFSYNYLRSFQFQAQYLAMAFTLLAIVLASQRKYIKSFICVAAAFGIHESAILMILPLVIGIIFEAISQKQPSKSGNKYQVVFLAIMIVILIAILKPVFSELVSMYVDIKGSRFSFYFGTSYDDGKGSGYLTVINMAIFAVMLLVVLMSKRESISSLLCYCIISQAFACGVCILGGVIPLTERLIFYYYFPQIISIPLMLNELIDDSKFRFFIGFVIIASYAMVQFGYLMPSDNDLVFTYQSIFDV